MEKIQINIFFYDLPFMYFVQFLLTIALAMLRLSQIF